MKSTKLISLITVLFLSVSTFCSCTQHAGDKNSNDVSLTETSTDVTSTADIASTCKLRNLMTEKERSSISVGNISLLENADSDASASSVAATPSNDNTVKIEWWTKADTIEWWTTVGHKLYCEERGNLTEEQYKDIVDSLGKAENDYINAQFIMIGGREYFGFMPPYNYDGGALQYSIGNMGQSDDRKTVDIASFDEFKVWYRDYNDNQVTEGMLSQEEADQDYSDMLLVFQSVIDKTYSDLEKGTYNSKYGLQDEPEDYKDKWEFDRDEVEKIKDSIKEISVYDEELDTDFIVHVTLPPDFDESLTYPVFVLTDGIWRFGNHPQLRKLMESGETQNVILVSIGYSFDIDGTDNAVRGKFFCDKSDLFLNFITDNLMPYLGEEYNINCAQSALYGHSLGGAFTHYAAFNSDLYDNQPFQYYIIGSPAFWSPYFLSAEKSGDYKSEYGYFDRNETLNKTLYITGGENEDADYAQYYQGNDSTLEGITNLMNRLKDHNVNTAESKIYENSNHYEYIPDMLGEFLKKYYGKYLKVSGFLCRY